MGTDDDGDFEEPIAPPPLPPDDRLWRHPSEVREHGLAGRPLVSPPPRAHSWAVVLVAGLTGAVLTTGVIALTGRMSPQVVERSVVEKVAVTPVVSSPMLRGERGVVAVAERLRPAIVRIDVERSDGSTGTGSGVLYRSDGLLLTSAHVVADARAIDVVLTDGRHLDGQVLGRDTVTDIAVVDLDEDELPVAVLGTAADLEVGAPTIAIGSPLGFDGGPSVTTGVISALERRVVADGGAVLHGMIQTDAPIAAGSSGGALVDASGAVIGITTAVASEASGRFGFATPIDLARRIAERLVADGHMVHGWIGVEGADLVAALAKSLGVAGGAVVRDVVGNSPAHTAGLTPDDVITEVDHHPVTSISALIVALREHDPGDVVVIGYWRDGEHHETSITIGERPPG